MPATTRQPSFALLLALAWLVIIIQLLAQYWSTTGLTLGDSDDAMRLAQLHDWLSGQGWYDLTQSRVAGGYETHWSRLIDLGLGGTLWLFGLFAEPTLAERLMRTAWPMLWLLPTMAGTAAIAWRIAGREAALLALLMAIIGLPALHQFRPGRIDHHNVQMALACTVLAATVWSDRVRGAALLAGAVSGLALGIGLESLPYLMLCGVAFGLRYVLDPTGAVGAVRYGLALSLASLAIFAATVAPDRWTRVLCDSFAVNWLALVMVGGLGLAVAAKYARERTSARLACALVTGTAACGLALWFDPRCAGGPYTVIDPAAWPIWLAHVRENKPLWELLAESPLTTIAIMAFPALTCAAGAALLAGKSTLRRDFGFLVAAAAFLIGVVMTVEAIRSATYAIWLGMPLVAAFALQLFAVLRLERLVPRVAVGAMLTPAVLSLGAVTIANAAGIGGIGDFREAKPEACFNNDSYAPLARIPAGVIAADVNFGPYLLALTPHSVLAAPYHRLASRIVTAHRMLAAEPDEARVLLARAGADYVMICRDRAPTGLSPAERDASLWGRLTAGAVPDWLELVPITKAQPISIYRVRS
jgi:hypothetical protein